LVGRTAFKIPLAVNPVVVDKKPIVVFCGRGPILAADGGCRELTPAPASEMPTISGFKSITLKLDKQHGCGTKNIGRRR
jgi:hypothetical protein